MISIPWSVDWHRFVAVLAVLAAPSVPCHRTRAQATQDTLVLRLNSPDPYVRVPAFTALSRRPGFFSSPAQQGTLLRLLERENELIRATLKESRGERGVSVKYGEGYSEYYSEMVDLCSRYCDRSDSRVVYALANAAYNPDSPFALDLVRRHGAQIIPIIEGRVRSGYSVERIEGLELLARIAATSSGLTAESRARIHGAIVAGAGDSEGFVREKAAKMLGEIGTAADRAFLQRMADQDPAPEVRAAARAALNKIPPGTRYRI